MPPRWPTMHHHRPPMRPAASGPTHPDCAWHREPAPKRGLKSGPANMADA